MFNLLDEMSELIYVVDRESYELLYMNRAGKELFGLDGLAGQKCYEVIQGLDAPCPQCNNRLLRSDAFYTWEYRNPKVGRHYLLKDRLVNWNGKMARAELAFDMTEKEEQREELKTALGIENVVTQCAGRLCNADKDNSSIDDVIRIVGEFLWPDRVYVFEIQGDLMSNTHEWCAPGAAGQMEHLQNIPVLLIERWRKRFENQECVLIEDLEALKDSNPREYADLKAQNIHSLIAAPLILEHQLIGYMGVDNYRFPMQKSAISLLTSVGYFVASFIRHKRVLKQLEQLVYHDSLTGLINRNGFIQDMEKEQRLPIGAVYVDVNGIKQVNDRYGHQEGDQILVDTARTLGEHFPDSACYRVGGDEYVIICHGLLKEEFEARIQKMRYTFRHKKQYSVSIGDDWSADATDLQKLLYYADEKMYRDKQDFYRGTALTARYRHQIDDVLHLTDLGTLEERMRQGCFPVYYQPKYSVRTGQMTGAEALVRFKTPEGILYSPDLFIPVLEEARLISALDFHVFESVCAQLTRWREAALPVLPVSTNFSRHTLSLENFAERLQAIRDKHGLPAFLLEVEVTETVDTDNKHLFYSILEQLKQKNFSISIDDFGVRNANLLLLTDVEFDVLKLDKSVVENLCKNERSRLLISELIKICHEMRVELIAEGIETEEQLEILRQADCDGVQGYLLGRPGPAAELEARLKSGRK